MAHATLLQFTWFKRKLFISLINDTCVQLHNFKFNSIISISDQSFKGKGARKLRKLMKLYRLCIWRVTSRWITVLYQTT